MSEPRQLTSTLFEAPPAVTRRVELLPIDAYIDQLMERMPGRTLRLSHAQDRAWMRQYLRLALEGYLNHLAWDLAKSAERGIRQAVELMIDPAYYQDRRERLRRQRARTDQQMLEARDRYLAEQAAELVEREQLEAEGKLASINRPRAVKPPSPPAEPEPPAS